MTSSRPCAEPRRYTLEDLERARTRDVDVVACLACGWDGDDTGTATPAACPACGAQALQTTRGARP